MKTFAERKALFWELMKDPDLSLTAKEAYTYWYYWYRYEIARINRARSRRNMNKFADKLNKNLIVYDLRRSMKNL